MLGICHVFPWCLTRIYVSSTSAHNSDGARITSASQPWSLLTVELRCDQRSSAIGAGQWLDCNQSVGTDFSWLSRTSQLSSKIRGKRGIGSNLGLGCSHSCFALLP